MPTNFKEGVLSRGIPAEAGGGTALIPGTLGKVFWVDSAASNASNNNDGSAAHPLATLAGAETLVSASRGDVVIVMPTHTETWATLAASPTLAKAGTRWFFVRSGALVATFTVGSAANLDATLTISGASITFGAPDAMPIFAPGVDSVVTPVTISGANVSVDYEVRDASAAIEFVRHLLTTAAADNLRANIKVRGFIAGNACVNSVRLVGVDGGRINVDFYGVASTSIVEFQGTACHNIVVTGRFYNSGTTDGTKNVVDTATGSTWYAEIEDGAAGARYTGGSAAALASDDISTLNTKIGTPVNTGGTASLGAILGDFANSTLVARLGALNQAAVAPGASGNVLGVLRDAWDALRNGTGGTEPGTNKSILDAIGFDGVAAIAASAGMLRVGAGTMFVVKKTLTSSAVVQAGVDVTAVSTVGDILIEDFTIQADGTGLAAGTNFTLEANNAKGSGVFASNAVAGLGANVLMDKKTASVGKSVVLETGKKVIAKCTVADCTGVGTIDVYLLCRRLADNATLAAA